MSVPLLTTKLFRPRARPDRVARPRLRARLGDVLQPGRKLALLCAPAGFGKTSLLADWASTAMAASRPDDGASDELPSRSAPLGAVTWLSLDASDDDPIRFWTYVLAALNAVRPGIGDALQAALAAPRPPPIDVVLTTLINRLAADPADAAPLVLVLDDYHLLTAPAIHDQLQFLVERLPPHLRLVLASRADPPLPLARWRARDELIELRAADLRFNTEEAVAFLTEVMGLGLGPAEVAALAARTEGWIAGLHLAGLAMRDRADLPGFIATFTGSNRFVVDFLAEEVLRQQPASLQAFLLQSSVLDRMCGPLCDAVMGIEARGARPVAPELIPGPLGTGQDTLEYLERANLFTVRLDDERRWYRYHHLFHDVLRERSRIEMTREQVTVLHRRASAWLADHKLIPEAVEHALTAADYPRAAELIEQDGLGMIARGQRSQVLAWLAALPTELRRARPRLGHLHAVILIQTNQIAAGEALLAQVERDLASIAPEDERHVVQGQILVSRAVLSWYVGDVATGTKSAEQALELLPDTQTAARIVATIYAVNGYRLTGDVTSARERQLQEAVALGRDLAREIGQVSPYAVTLVALGRMQVLQGRRRLAAQTFEQARDLLGSPVERWSGHSALSDVAQGELLREQNDLDEAERLIRQGLAAMEGPTTAAAETILAGSLSLAWLRQARGDRHGAHLALDGFDALARRRGYFPGLLAQSAAARAHLALAQGDLPAATRWAESAGLNPNDEICFLRESEYATLARVWIAQGRVEPAIRLLERQLGASEAGERWGSAIGLLVLLALAHQASENRAAAMVHLERTLVLAVNEGYVRTFVDEGPAMLALLREARERRIHADQVDRLLAAFRREPGSGEPEPREAGDPDAGLPHDEDPTSRTRSIATLAEPISEREIEVLRLIAAGCSNQEIADTLVIALGTVKKHVNNLYGKLAVNSRTQALVRARALDLL